GDPRRQSAGVHAARRPGGAGGDAADRQRQGGPQGPARARAHGGRRWRSLEGAAQPPGAGAGAAVERSSGRRRGGDPRHPRQLLPGGRQLDHRRDLHQPLAGAAGGDRPRGDPVRRADPGATRRPPRRGVPAGGRAAVGGRNPEAYGARTDRQGRRVNEELLAEVRRLLPGRAPEPEGLKNPRAVFILSPPRSGSTLLRVMLAGHPELFAPPELELLHFATLDERRDAFSGRDAFRLEGLLRAVMEARACTAEEAREIVAGLEAAGCSTRELYRRLQEWIGGRLLVDKTPTY